MSTLYTDTLAPSAARTLLLGGSESGDTVTVRGTSFKSNSVEDSGGNILFQSDGNGDLSNVNGAFGGGWRLITTQVAVDATNIEFKSKIDSNHSMYIFKFININPDTDGRSFTFQISTDRGAHYGVNKTTSVFTAHNDTAGTAGQVLVYQHTSDLSDSTDYQALAINIGNHSKECASGQLYLFNPSNTTYAKQFYSRMSAYSNTPPAVRTTLDAEDMLVGGYASTELPINSIRFKMTAGNFDGTIKMYGVL